PLPAPVLVDDDAAEDLRARRYPDRVIDRVNQFARLARSLIAHAVVRRLGRREDVVGRLLGGQARPPGHEKKAGGPAEVRGRSAHGTVLLKSKVVASATGRGCVPSLLVANLDMIHTGTLLPVGVEEPRVGLRPTGRQLLR